MAQELQYVSLPSDDEGHYSLNKSGNTSRGTGSHNNSYREGHYCCQCCLVTAS